VRLTTAAALLAALAITSAASPAHAAPAIKAGRSAQTTGAAQAVGAAPAVPQATPSPSVIGDPVTDITPPSKPSGLFPCPPPAPTGGPAMVGICWTASTDNVAVTGYDIYILTTTGFVRSGTTSGTTYIASGLVYGRAYTFFIVARDAAANTSQPSDLFTGTAVTGYAPTPTPTPTPPPDTTPPSGPTGLSVCGADFVNAVPMCWTASTDNVGVTRYDVYRQTPTGYVRAGSATSAFFTDSGLVGGRLYTYFVVALDAADNISRPSALFTARAQEGLPSPSPTPSPAACKVTYSVTAWTNGFTATITITNTGTASFNGWNLRFAFPGSGQKVTQGWSAVWTQTGVDVTAVNLSWNTVIPAGQSVQIGFNGSHTGTNPRPAAFTLNGTACTVT
jgi:cellulose 1,4-beta-cellobiosidase